MTKEEAIKRLKDGEPFSEIYDLKWDIALQMAISALSVPKRETTDRIEYGTDGQSYKYSISTDITKENKGEWIKFRSCCREYKCSKCEYEHCRETNFCPNCGADMRPEPYKAEGVSE